ncbi:MAG: endonuclease MutS2 [Candidatus Cloacimonadales bacterium]|jgi:DNA mismatch repair protein MutS2|nr:endonuclease MutS2 [Candidatus Cloacimonadota bacterium]MDD2650326.1 endonuclease MutS2 [Candidatus Cloacimonadota bacterium]MDD3500966.1 endonuclease MutS2 [Candidatus Cloacimonadota bacterium]MDX9976624.1 endonuclease MutS2 [Candidatus Cloacimonadales bacterium]
MYNTFHHLEFNKIIELIKKDTHSFNGKIITESIKPLNAKQDKIDKLQLINELQRISILGYNYHFETLIDLKELLLEWEHSSYNFEEFTQIIECVKITNKIYSDKESFLDYPIFTNKILKLSPFFYLEKRFYEIFSAEGEVLDTASKELMAIRKRKKQLRSNILKVLDDIQKNQSWENYLQDKIISHRDDRYVLLIKEGASGFVDGISHGRSASNASIYFEPKQVMNLNNDLNKTNSDEQQEIYRIFTKYSQEIFEVKKQIYINSKILSQLDSEFAIARFSNKIMANPPLFVDLPIIELTKARHPLLIVQYNDIKKVIPFDLKLGKEKKLMLISGPNTGGKTVTLKTIGLLTLMAHSGLPIPADSNSQIGKFDKVYADIGDNQSIESYLSSFSAHIKNIAEMLEKGDENTLILIDEIGAATDPEQGSALAQAVLEKFVQKGVTGIITTHYTALKIYAEQSESCVNASMQFDSKSHLPTYQFNFGMPGHSFAIEIAAKLGIEKSVIDKAKELAGNQSVELTHLITKLNDEKKYLGQATYKLDIKTKLLEQRISEYEKKTDEIEEQKKVKISEALKRKNEELTHLQRELIAEIEEIKKINKAERKQKLEEALNKTNNLQNDILKQSETLIMRKSKAKSNDKIKVGSVVWLEKLETKATVIELNKGNAKVDMNGIFFNSPMTDLVLLENKKEAQEAIISSQIVNKEDYSNIELKVLGLTFLEAMPQIDQFLDNAILNRLNRVRIVHGKGTGALRTKVRSYLKKNKRVVDFFAPPIESGGDGVTVVCLK